ncbi:hypothetical protein [Gluconobacter cerinus]|uniref:hypothetical protein n=1 Tax=Gluconobacter cerinus TaxID=38307 RepID=UPI002011482B|nr:hypothetical protein [Gluconobacter cerinus]
MPVTLAVRIPVHLQPTDKLQQCRLPARSAAGTGERHAFLMTQDWLQAYLWTLPFP